MRFVSKNHAALRVIDGGKEPTSVDESPFLKLRAEQALHTPQKPLTSEEIAQLRTVPDQSRR